MTTSDIPTEALEAVRARVKGPLHEAFHALGPRIPNLNVGDCHCNLLAEVALDAVLAAAAPHLIAEGRRRAAAELRAYADNYPEDVFRPGGTSTDAIAGTAMRHAYRNAAVIAEGTNHG